MMECCIGVVIVVIVFVFISKDIRANEEAKRREEAKRKEEEKREQSSFRFSDGISEKDFKWIVSRSGKNIKRLAKLSTDGSIVHGTVWAQSGISKWNFTIDFNDYGHLTGKYWLSSDNSDSNIPNTLAKRIQNGIRDFDQLFIAESNTTETDCLIVFCPNCGAKIEGQDVRFCPYCGKKFDV